MSGPNRPGFVAVANDICYDSVAMLFGMLSRCLVAMLVGMLSRCLVPMLVGMQSASWVADEGLLRIADVADMLHHSSMAMFDLQLSP